MCGGAAPDPPLKRAGSSRLIGGRRYHPPPGGGAPPARPERWKWREPAPAGYWGTGTVPFPAEGCVCVFLEALSAGEGAARGGLRDAAEPGVLGEPGGSPVEMPLVPL